MSWEKYPPIRPDSSEDSGSGIGERIGPRDRIGIRVDQPPEAASRPLATHRGLDFDPIDDRIHALDLAHQLLGDLLEVV
jgi:hypothetical protein